MQLSPVLHLPAAFASAPSGSMLFGEGLQLVSWWKPLVLLLPLLGWLWFISAVLDKHAARFHLGRQKWNLINLVVGFVAVIGSVLLPVPGALGVWASFGLLVVVFTADVLIFVTIANRDPRVPEAHHLRIDLTSLKEARTARASAKLQGKASLVIRGPDGVTIDPPEKETPEFQVRVAAEALFINAMEARASQVQLLPTGKDNAYVVQLLVDGVRQRADALPAADAIRVMDFWKAAAKLDTQDRRRKLTGKAVVGEDAMAREVRVESIGTSAGMRLTMAFDVSKAVDIPADDLGLIHTQMEELKRIAEDALGVVLVAAPPGNGLSTTLYAVSRLHDAYTCNVQTVETEVLLALEGVRQNLFDPLKEGAEHATLVRSILRRDPDVVMVADVMDDATALECTRADQERTRTYLGLRADSALRAIQVWTKRVGQAEPASRALHGVMAQRLLRRLCTNCRVPYQPAPDMLKKLGLPVDKVKQLFKKGGQVMIKNKPEVCPMCRGAGYFGQTGIFEVYQIGPPERDLVGAGDLAALRAELRKKRLPSLQQAALRKAIEGVTSVEEVIRVTSPPKKKPPAAPKATAKPPAVA